MEKEGKDALEMEEEAHEKREAQAKNESRKTLILFQVFISANI